MDELFLVAHKVRGEPAFDIAQRMRCPICEPMKQGLDDGSAPQGCDECEGEGYWWIIPTSGHRAHPYRYWNMDDLYDGSDMDMPKPLHVLDTIAPPPTLPDHYPTRASPKPADLTTLLGLNKPSPSLLTLRRPT